MTVTHSDVQPVSATRDVTFSGLALASVLIAFVVLQGLALRLTGGAFEYPLDDPYIHLALAEQIAGGGYGVNAGEYASPGSSALFPFLLIPFAGHKTQRYMPLFWNVVGMGLTAWLWGALLSSSGWMRPGWRGAGIAAAVLGPVAVMMPMVAFVGMEHTLHAAAALAVLLGLWRHFNGGGGIALVLIGITCGSALRPEGMALALLVGGALFLTGSRGAGIAAAALGILPVALFAGFLAALGLDPVPSSVQSKLALGAGQHAGVLQERFAVIVRNLSTPAGKLVLGLAIAIFLLWRLAPGLKERRWSAFALVLIFAALAHLAAGQIGWLNRYEHYVLVLMAAGFLTLLPVAFADRVSTLRAWGAVALVVGGGFVAYNIPRAFVALPQDARAIQNQQGQMAVFAKDYLNAEVAVNDLGWVAWRNQNYVLDLWGLASAEARRARLTNPAPGWTGALADRRGVPVAMVYDHWFQDGIGTNWVRVGQLDLTSPGGFLGGRSVAFYATRPEHVEMLRAALARWIPTLRPGSRFVWQEGMRS